MFENKKIFILGMAKSGYEVAKFLAKYNNEIVITDNKEQDIEHVNELKKLGIKVFITENPLEIFDSSFNYVIKNPGVKYDHLVLLKAKELNIKVINELEMSYSFLPKNIKIIGVTGSNGKTTTVTLINEILKQTKNNIHLGGNIGIPLSAMIDKIKENDILLIEISDHQLCDMYNFKTNISVLTNISETHIDFHDSYDRYKEMKKRIFNNHTTNDLAIINIDNEESLELIKNISSKKLYFGSKGNCYIKNNNIYYNDELVISLNDIKLKGIHNYENILATILVVKEFNVSNEDIYKVLNTFNGVEHRLEYVNTINNRIFYNDSKSTNNIATITALKSFNNSTILIMGGLDRNISFDEIGPHLKNVKKIVCYGETKNKIYDLALKNNIDCSIFDNLKGATIDAYNSSIEGDIILLSPACASWDQYKCFEDRGNEFKNIVNNLIKESVK